MLVRNWMRPDPITVAPALLVSEAKRIISENNLHALPVVEGGRLRGLVTRANLLRMGHFVLHTQDPDEFNYFVTRVRVRDVMLRNPATVQASDPMDHCLRKGQELGVAQFPVLEGDTLVGIITANEIFQLVSHCLGAWEHSTGLTLAPVELGPGVLGRIASTCEAAGAVLQAIYPIGRLGGRSEDGSAHKRVVVRFHAPDAPSVLSALRAAGFPVVEAGHTGDSAPVAFERPPVAARQTASAHLLP